MTRVSRIEVCRAWQGSEVRPRARGRRDAGIALAAVLGGVLALCAMALTLALLATIETGIGDAERARVEVMTAADAAMEAAIASLAEEDDWSAVLAEARRSAVLAARDPPRVAGWGVLDVAACTRDVQRATAAAVDWGADLPVWALYVEGVPGELGGRAPPRNAPYALVWVADDEADGDAAPLRDANGLLTLRAEAFGLGRARAAVVATVRRRPAGVEVVSWRPG